MQGEHERGRVGGDLFVVLVAVLDEQREGLGLALEPSGDDRQGAVLTQRAGEREDDAVGERPADRRAA